MASLASLPLDVLRQCIVLPHLGHLDAVCLRQTSKFFRDALKYHLMPTLLRYTFIPAQPLEFYIQPWTTLGQVVAITPNITHRMCHVMCRDALDLGYYAMLERVSKLCPVEAAVSILGRIAHGKLHARVPKTFAHVKHLLEVHHLEGSLLKAEQTIKKLQQQVNDCMNSGARYVPTTQYQSRF